MPMHEGGETMDLLWSLIGLTLIAIPMARIFYRAGFSWAWAILIFFPYLGWAVCWIILGSRTWRWRRSD